MHLNVTRNAVPIDFNPAYEIDVFETLDGWEFVTPDAAAAIGTLENLLSSRDLTLRPINP